MLSEPVDLLKLQALGPAILCLQPSHQVHSIALLNLSIHDVIPNPPLTKRNCDNPMATSNVLDEEDLV